MAKAGVELVGLREANRALRQLPDLAKGSVQQVHDVTAFQVARAASAKAPRSADGSHGNPPGFLAAAIRWESRPRSLSAVVGVGAAAFYWKFLEYGTRFLSARPFLRPAADENRRDHRSRLIDALSRAATRVKQLAR
jgi:HK97 gp10 family phage protein